MKVQTAITILTATMLALASFSAAAQGSQRGKGANPPDRAQIERGQKDFDRDRLRDRDRISAPERDRDRTRDQDRTHVPDNAKLGENGIYGEKLMSVQERNQYREQLRLTESDPQARSKFMAQHQEKMQARAKAQGVDIGSPGLGPKYGDGNQEGPGPGYGNGIYGGELMSVQERNQYREQLRLTESDPQARTKFMAKHQEKMQVRAKQMGVEIEPTPEVEEAE
ncbi:MAG: hypothetical protein WBN07_02190 [Woeseiaceae bacterium]